MIVVRTFYCDGGLVPPMICVIELWNGIECPTYACVPKSVTSHESEYLGLYQVFSLCDEGDEIEIYMDDQLPIKQFRGEWKTKEYNFVVMLELIREIIREKGIVVKFIRYIRNKRNPAGKRLKSVQKYFKKHGTIIGWYY